MPLHPRVHAWIAHNYQKPAIDQEWLSDCSDWLSSELGLDPTKDFDKFIQHVEAQLLQSNLVDSTVPGSGIDPLLVTSNAGPPQPRPFNVRRPGRQAPRQKKTTGETPLLVEIKSITEIAHSAFSLLNTHQTRLDRVDLGLAQGDNAEQHSDEDEEPVPRFPRGMLKFELSDGVTIFRAIEFRSLPQLELGTTPLGYKMFLKSTPIRNGVAFLEPSNVVLKGYQTADHDINREHVFLSLLRKRLGRPDPAPEAPVAPQARANPPGPAPVEPQTRPERPPPVAQRPPPPADIDDMYADDDVDPDVLREMAIQMDEAIAQEHKRVSARAPPPAVSSSTSKVKSVASSTASQPLHVDTTNTSSLQTSSNPSSVKTSPYFTPLSFGSKAVPDIGLSPRHALPSGTEPDIDITWDVDDPEPSSPLIQKTGSASARPRGPPETRPSSPDPYDDLSFDMDVDDSFLEQVGMIEQGALGAGTSNKGKGKDTGPVSRPSVAPAGKTPSGPGAGTNISAHCPVSASSAEPGARVQSSTNRATSASSMSGSTESAIPRSTQSSDRRLPRDPSLIVISSSEDEAPGVRGGAKPLDLARRRTHKGMELDSHEVVDPDVIDLSD